MFLSKILLRRSSKNTSIVGTKKRNSPKRKFEVCVPRIDKLESYRAVDFDGPKKNGLMRAVIVDCFLNTVFDKRGTRETLTPLIEEQLEGFIVVGKNVRCDINRLIPDGRTWKIIDVTGEIYRSKYTAHKHDTEEDARGAMLILVEQLGLISTEENRKYAKLSHIT